MSSALFILILGIAFLYYYSHHPQMFGPHPAVAATTPAAPVQGGGGVAAVGSRCNPAIMQGIGVPSRLQFNNCVTVTGTIVGEAPHYAPDGDMVFALKLDPQYSNLVNEKNNVPKYQGGIWIEAICQQQNKSPEPWHKGDCAKGGPFPKFQLPKTGDRMMITGIHAIDTREGGHAEIHPVTDMQILNSTSAKAGKVDPYWNSYNFLYMPQQSLFANNVKFSNIQR